MLASTGVQPTCGSVRFVIDNHDWRLEGQESSLRAVLRGVELRLVTWSTSDGHDHDHCEFCWARISDRPRAGYEYDRAYATLDQRRWICEPCFDDFRDRFALVVISDSVA
jgi:hypothetical protein